MMHPLALGGDQPVHKFKLCNKCNEVKPPEGGIDMGTKWHCQHCWTRRMTSANLNKRKQ
jgi:hypothetical protein